MILLVLVWLLGFVMGALALAVLVDAYLARLNREMEEAFAFGDG